MSNTEKQALLMNIERLTALIDTYRRRLSVKKNMAFHYAECGYRESAMFNKGQAFALGYVADDLQIVLDSLNDLLSLEVSGDD